MKEKYRFVEVPQTILSSSAVYHGPVLTVNVLLRLRKFYNLTNDDFDWHPPEYNIISRVRIIAYSPYFFFLFFFFIFADL